MFSTFSAFVVLIWMLIYVFGGKRRKSSSFSLSVYRPKKYNPNEVHYEHGCERRAYSHWGLGAETQAILIRKLNIINMGNFIDTSGPINNTFLNSIIKLYGTTYEFAYVYDYEKFRNGECLEHDLPYSFDILKVADMHVACSDRASYLTITTSRDDKEQKFIFEFPGYSGRYEARDVRERIWQQKERTQAVLYN